MPSSNPSDPDATPIQPDGWAGSAPPWLAGPAMPVPSAVDNTGAPMGAVAPMSPVPAAAPMDSNVPPFADPNAVGAPAAMAPGPAPTGFDMAAYQAARGDYTGDPNDTKALDEYNSHAPNAQGGFGWHGTGTPDPRAMAAATTSSGPAIGTPPQPPYAPGSATTASAVSATAPFAVDAVSGGPAPANAEDPNAALHRIATDPNASVADRQAAWQTLTPDERTNLVNNTDPKQLSAIATAAMSQEELATIGVRHEQQRIHEESAAKLQLAQQQDEQARQSYQTYQTAQQRAATDSADVSAQADALSREKIDPEEHGVGAVITNLITATVGGFVSSGTGGKNLALEAIDKQTDRRIQAQKDNIANRWQGLNFKRNMIAEQLQRSGDMYKAETTYRLSQYDRALSELQTKQQDYDPRGTTALKIAASTQQIQTQRQQTLQVFQQQQFENHIKTMTADNAAATLKESVREHNQTNSLGWANFGQKKADDAQKNQIELAKLATENQKNANAQGALQRDQGITVPSGTTTDANGNTQVAYAPLTQQDGKTVFIAPKDQAKDLQDLGSATDKAVRYIDQMRADRKANGGHLANTAESRKMAQDFAGALMAVHEAGGVKRFSEDTINLMKGELSGGADPDSVFKSIMPSLDDARGNIVNDYDSALRNKGQYTGKKVEFFDPVKNAPVTNPDDAAFKFGLKDPEVAHAPYLPSSLGSVAEDASGQAVTQIKGTIDQYAAVLQDPNAPASAKAQASDRLNQLATQGGNGAIRDYAQSVAAAATAPPSSAMSGDVDSPGGAVAARETVPPVQMHIDALAKVASAGDVAAQQELIRRAHTGDKQAKAVLATLIGSGK